MTKPDKPDEPTRLLAEAERAATLRAHQTDPAVVALVVEQTRAAIERTMWIGITLGMAFTTVSVQQWGATGLAQFSLGWFAAWLLAPLVEVPLLAILRGESTASRYGVEVGGWVKRARWTLLICAYGMNTLGPWGDLVHGGGSFDEVLRHSVPVVAVLVGVEALTDLRAGLSRAVTAAVESAAAAAAATKPPPRKAAPPARPRPPRERAAVSTSPDTLPEPDDDEVEAATVGELAAARGLREFGVGWAVEHWRDDLRPVEIGDALAKLGRPVSKSERGKIRNAAAAIVAEREVLAAAGVGS